jgi:hypothetical protein
MTWRLLKAKRGTGDAVSPAGDTRVVDASWPA